ncbi:MAG: hypothetical protein RBR15_07005 [Sphaerochaeta sp.]|nr:hypothetical protein [Sphaerochaeta sp.]
MKKKFVLTLALVLMVAVTLTAAPIELSGNFKAGYTMTFASGGNGIAGKNIASEISLGALSVSGDFWKVAIADGVAITPGDNKMAATATIYLDKALAEQGMDMGDLAVTLTIGNKTTLGGLSAYTNSRDALTGLKMDSTDPARYSSAVQVDYTKLVSVYVGADLAAFETANKAIVLSAKSMPVDGVTAAVAYTNMDANSVDGSVAGSVAVDVAKLAGIEDFGLTVSAYDVYFFTPKTNNLYVELKGSYDKISAWTEYRIINKTNDMKLKVSFSGIENVGLSAFVELNDLTKVVKTTTKVGAGVTYAMGGVTYAIDMDYATATEVFTLAPTVKISF